MKKVAKNFYIISLFTNTVGSGFIWWLGIEYIGIRKMERKVYFICILLIFIYLLLVISFLVRCTLLIVMPLCN
jgi:hypothetical protein